MARFYNRIEVSGIENIPEEGGFIVASNHLSNIDPPLIGGMIRRRLHYMAKEELFSIPLLGGLITSLGAFPVKRAGASSSAVSKVIELVGSGSGCLIFPEGTRSRDGRLGPFKRGGVVLAMRCGVPVVPAGISGTEKALPPGSFLFRPARIRLSFGRPLDLGALGRGREAEKEAMERLRGAIASLLPEEITRDRFPGGETAGREEEKGDGRGT